MIVNGQLAKSSGCDQKDKWETPDHIFNPLNEEFGFSLDPACEIKTAKCQLFFTPKEDGLAQDWSGHVVFCNPPYSRGNIDRWIRKCAEEGDKPDTVVVALIPVSTSSRWFHKWVWRKAEIRYFEGRIRFKSALFTAPFSSMLAIYKASA